jgi:hypothetical protein
VIVGSLNDRIFSPAKAAKTSKNTELVFEDAIAPKDELKSWSKDYELFFVNTMHMYLRIPVSLFELYAKQFNKKLHIMHFVLPEPILVEDVVAPAGFNQPEAGWSRYVQGLPKEEWSDFRNWMLNSKWMAADSKGNKILYSCESEEVLMRDPVKLQTMQIVGIREFVSITFFLPSNPVSNLYLNTKNGPPFHCVYVSRSSSGPGEAASLFQKLRETS